MLREGEGFSASTDAFMLTDLRHLVRLFAILRCFARHDALLLLGNAPPAYMGDFSGSRRMLRLFQALFGRRRPGLREGERLAAALSELGPSFIKLGQVLSVRPDLVGAGLAEDLGRLRDRLPPFSWREAKATIESELGRPLDEIFTGFEPEPVAAPAWRRCISPIPPRAFR